MQRTHTWRQNTLRSRVQALRLAPPYLRHAPPSLYVTCDMQRESGAKTTLQRHSTRLLDSSIDDDATSTLPPHSHGSYMLSSTSFEDLQFRDASAITRAMVGLPKLHTVDQVRRFMEKHAEHLNNLTLVALPEVHPTTPMVLHTLLQAYPAATISCSAFGRALLSDETFFHGVKKAMIRNAHPSTAEIVSNTLTFAGIPADRITEVSGDAELPLGDAQGRRKLRAYPTPASNSKTGKNTLPAHFEPRRVVFFDTAFQCAHIGDAALRLPWMPRLLRECRADTILPSPHLLHVQYGDARTSPVLHHFDSMSSTASLISTLKRIPYTQRVCSSSFGEFPGDADSFGRALERSAVRLEELRSRLAKRLETDTSLDTRRWSAAVSRRLVEELLREQRSAEATEDGILEDIHHWAEDSNSPLGHLSCCLTASARALPPTTVTSEPAPPRASPKPAGQRPQVERESAGDDEEMEGAAGVQLLTSIFMKKNLAGLVKCLEKQEIDVPVFLSMSTQDFQKVFKATFGLSKKLELLQTELKQHIQSLRNERDGGQKLWGIAARVCMRSRHNSHSSLKHDAMKSECCSECLYHSPDLRSEEFGSLMSRLDERRPLRDKLDVVLHRIDQLYQDERHAEVVHELQELFDLADGLKPATDGCNDDGNSGSSPRPPSSHSNGCSARPVEDHVNGDVEEELPTNGEPPTPTLTSSLSSSTTPSLAWNTRLLHAFINVINYVRQSHMFSESQRRLTACTALSKDLADHTSWTSIREEKDGGLWYRHDPSSGSHFFKAAACVDVSLIYACCVLLELDLYSEWFPFCTRSQPLGEISRFHKAAYFVLHSPWPFKDRDILFLGYGMDDLEHNQRIVIVARGLDERTEPLPEGIADPHCTGKTVRAKVAQGGFSMEMVSPRRTRISFIVAVDPQIPKIPQWGINWVSAKVLWHMLHTIGSQAKHAAQRHGVYYERRKERPDIYIHLRTRYNEMLQRCFPSETLLASDY